MIRQPMQVEQALVDQIGRFARLVFDDYGIVVLRDGEGVDSTCVECSGAEFGRDETAVERRGEIALDQLLELLL